MSFEFSKGVDHGEPISDDPRYSPNDVARIAMATLLTDRRVATDTCPPVDVCEPCIKPHADKLTGLVEDRAPLQLMLLAFPCKSPNPNKVIGDLPDMAELISLTHIDGWAKTISTFYEPGAEVIIGADGRAFADLVEVPDETVSAYVDGINQIINRDDLSITYVGVDELMPDLAEKKDYDGLREALQSDAVSIEALRERAQQNPDFAYQVNGIERFLTDDLRHVFPDMSKTQLKKLARQRAYEIIQRGDVLRHELELRYPQAARLSVHPQTSHSGKLGVHITPSRDDWVTPWHAAAIQQNNGHFRLTKSRDAREQGAALIYLDDDRPSHFKEKTEEVIR